MHFEIYETAKIMKFTKTGKFGIIVKTSEKINEIYLKGSKEGPLKFMKTYDNCQDHCQSLQHLFRGLQGQFRRLCCVAVSIFFNKC